MINFSKKVWAVHYDGTSHTPKHVVAKTAEEAARDGQKLISYGQDILVVKVEFVAELEEPKP